MLFFYGANRATCNFLLNDTQHLSFRTNLFVLELTNINFALSQPIAPEVVAHLDNVLMKGTREIEMQNIATGQYMVKISNANKLFTEKVYLSHQ
jgi:hypothetical protein